MSLEEFKDNDQFDYENNIKLICGHVFKREPLMGWLKHLRGIPSPLSCPLCKTPLQYPPRERKIFANYEEPEPEEKSNKRKRKIFKGLNLRF